MLKQIHKSRRLILKEEAKKSICNLAVLFRSGVKITDAHKATVERLLKVSGLKRKKDEELECEYLEIENSTLSAQDVEGVLSQEVSLITNVVLV